MILKTNSSSLLALKYMSENTNWKKHEKDKLDIKKLNVLGF